jgi:hypothetical protein
MGQGASCTQRVDAAETKVAELSHILTQLRKPLPLETRQLLILRSAKITEDLHKAAHDNIIKATRNFTRSVNTNTNKRKNLINTTLTSLPGQPSSANVDAELDKVMSHVAMRPLQVPATFRGGEKERGGETRKTRKTRKAKKARKAKKSRK